MVTGRCCYSQWQDRERLRLRAASVVFPGERRECESRCFCWQVPPTLADAAHSSRTEITSGRGTSLNRTPGNSFSASLSYPPAPTDQVQGQQQADDGPLCRRQHASQKAPLLLQKPRESRVSTEEHARVCRHVCCEVTNVIIQIRRLIIADTHQPAASSSNQPQLVSDRPSVTDRQ